MRRWLRGVAIATALVAGLLALALYAVYPYMGEREIRRRLPMMFAQYGLSVSIGDISVELGKATVTNLGLQPMGGGGTLVAADVVNVDFDTGQSFRGRAHIGDIRVTGVTVTARRGGKDDNIGAVLDVLRKRKSSDKGGTRSKVRWERIVVEDATLQAVDSETGTRASVGGLGAELTHEKGRVVLTHVALQGLRSAGASVREVILTVDRSDPRGTAVLAFQGGQVMPVSNIALTEIHGTLRPSVDSAVAIELAGSYGGAKAELWSAKGTLDLPSKSGSLELTAEQFRFIQIADILEGTPVVDYEDSTLSASLSVKFSPTGGVATGHFEVSDLSVFHPRVAEKPIAGVSLHGDVDVHVDRTAERIELRRADISLGKATYKLTGSVQMVSGTDPETEEVTRKPVLKARLQIPRIPCQDMLESIPTGFVPYMDGFVLRGMIATDVSVEIDGHDLDATKLIGGVGINGCRVRSAPKDIEAKRWLEPFKHWVQVDGGWVSFLIGPDNPDFVPYDEISQNLVKAIITTEDSRFFEHRGFITREFRSALVKDLKAGYFKYGASSITMQMVKNVILYREKTISRKFQELFFTWYLEQTLPKERILEIYFNAIEYGPGLYGIGPAAKEYFDKHPSELTAVEGAFFSSILPNPKKRYMQLCDGELNRWTTRKVQRILKIMHKRERLTDDEFLMAQVAPLEFSVDSEESAAQCRRRAEKFIEEHKTVSENPRKR